MTIDGLYWVQIFRGSIWNPLPTFHRPGGCKVADTETTYRTGCGRTYAVSTKASGYDDLSLSIPTRHALKFGRPCRLCFPEGLAS